ncbi:diaminopimelate epimerase [bacterium]|nr:diaminopimelate epimerase [bacterium]
MTSYRFAKMSGAGNDFIVIDNRGNTLPDINVQKIQKLCARRLSVGADGLLILSAAPDADFRMRYYNADGSEAAMCGNGGRCISRFAVLVGAGKEGQVLTFMALSGKYTAKVHGEQVKLSIIPPAGYRQDISLALSGGERQVDFIDTGVPHAVFFSDKVETEPVVKLGREVRQHPQFQPQGTNVNFCQVVDQHHLVVRTYERGVEDETLACGTGAAAAALLAAKRGLVQSPVKVKTHSQVELTMEFRLEGDGFADIFQQGEARLIYWGESSEEATAFLPANSK